MAEPARMLSFQEVYRRCEPVRRDRRVGQVAKYAHLHLAVAAGGFERSVYLTLAGLAADFNVTPRAAGKWIDGLADAGLVEVVDRDPRGTWHVYLEDPEQVCRRVEADPQTTLFEIDAEPPAELSPIQLHEKEEEQSPEGQTPATVRLAPMMHDGGDAASGSGARRSAPAGTLRPDQPPLPGPRSVRDDQEEVVRRARAAPRPPDQLGPSRAQTSEPRTFERANVRLGPLSAQTSELLAPAHEPRAAPTREEKHTYIHTCHDMYEGKEVGEHERQLGQQVRGLANELARRLGPAFGMRRYLILGAAYLAIAGPLGAEPVLRAAERARRKPPDERGRKFVGEVKRLIGQHAADEYPAVLFAPIPGEDPWGPDGSKNFPRACRVRMALAQLGIDWQAKWEE